MVQSVNLELVAVIAVLSSMLELRRMQLLRMGIAGIDDNEFVVSD